MFILIEELGALVVTKRTRILVRFKTTRKGGKRKMAKNKVIRGNEIQNFTGFVVENQKIVEVLATKVLSL